MNRKDSSQQIRRIAGLALFSAIVILLQLVGSFIRFGMFSVSLVLVPIVVGAALYGKSAGAYLGAIFGLSVLLSGDAAPFLAITPLGTVITVIGKGICAGFAAGFIYDLLKGKSRFLAVFTASVACPIINTGIFLLCCKLFFIDAIGAQAMSAGYGRDIWKYMLFVIAGGNFIFEMVINIVLNPVTLRIIDLGKKSFGGK